MSSHLTLPEQEVQTGSPLLRHYDDRNGHNDRENQNNFLVPMLPNQQSSTLSVEQQQSHTTEKNDSISSALPAHDSNEKPSFCRRAKTAPAIGQAVLDICITITSVYFVAFAIITISQDGKSAKSKTAENILDAARLGPTIWPIVFSAVIGRFLTSIATWRLERGVDVASVEYLLGSRTVFGVISTPVRLRFLHYALPLLLSLWVLSPLGGQASLRVVTPGLVYSNQTITVAYLESLSPYWLGGSAGGSDGGTYAATINAVFIGALTGPQTIKDAYQDIYGNLKIPLLESIKTQSSHADADGWFPTKTDAPLIYSSLLGLPTVGIPEQGKTYLAIESSYLYPTCTLSVTELDAAWYTFRRENCHNGNSGYMAIDLDLDHEPSDLYAPVRDPGTVTKPRTIKFGSMGTMATCVTTTTYVETRFICDGRQCEPTAIRESTLKHIPTAATFLDGVDSNHASSLAASNFCSFFINSTGVIHAATFSALERYFTNTDTPFADPGAMSPIVGIDDTVFSQRFAQLINTYWLALVAPFSITGNFSAHENGSLRDQGGKGTARNTTAQLETVESVLVCHTVWLVLLLLGSLVMIVAGIATTVINLFRKAPEVLDSFAGMLRDSPHVRVETGPSTEDAPDKARRLRKTRVILGDVRPTGAVGYVAFATCEGKDDGDGVQRLRTDRTYW